MKSVQSAKSAAKTAFPCYPSLALEIRNPQSEIAVGVDFEHAPRLLGFVKARPRPGSETILKADSGEPLLVRWQYGLGRVTAFLSDARNRWAAEWLRWDGYDALWPQIIRDVCHRSRTVRAGVRPDEREDEAVVYYDVVADAAFASAWPEHPRVAAAGGSGAATGPACRLAATHSW